MAWENFVSVYNFCPLSSIVVLPDWADEVSHDHPFQDGWCGELKVKLTTHSELCVGGRKDDSDSPGILHFYRNGNGDISIPPTTLKGALNNVLKIAGLGKMNQLDNRRFSVREITPKNKSVYQQKLEKGVQAGWLTFEGGSWQITPCKHEKIRQENLVTSELVSLKRWAKSDTTPERYDLLNGLQKVHYAIDTKPLNKNNKPNKNYEKAVLQKDGKPGYLVVGGQPSGSYDKRDTHRQHEHIFFHNENENPTPLLISERVFSDFQLNHQESDGWDYLLHCYRSQTKGFFAIPVFYQSDSRGVVTSFGLTRLYRLAYPNSTQDLVKNSGQLHTDSRPDLAETIFGYLDADNPDDCLKGRVQFSHGEISENAPKPVTTPSRKLVLNSPKPTFYPAYLEQPHRQDGTRYSTYFNDKAKLRGFKRYPVKKVNIGHTHPSMDDIDNDKIKSELENINEGAEFFFTIRFHNLKTVELGALLWALDFGGRKQLRHSIGAGKPYGFGQIAMALESWDLKANDPSHPGAEDQAALPQYLKNHFEQFMNLHYQHASGNKKGDWKALASIQQLLAMADPNATGGQLSYLPLSDEDDSNVDTYTNIKRDLKFLHPHDTEATEIGALVGEPSQAKDLNSDVWQTVLESTQNKIQKQAREAAWEAEKDSLPEEMVVIEEAILEVQGLANPPTASSLKRLPKKINAVRDALPIEHESADEKISLLEELCEPITNSRVQSALKSLRKKLQSIDS